MLKLGMLISLIVLFSTSKCTAPNSTHQNPATNQNAAKSVNSRNWMIGTWEGREWYNGQENHLIMYVIFKDDTLTVDYSPTGGAKFTMPYKFKDERTIETDRYSDGLVIDRRDDNVIEFRGRGKKMEESVELIYVCKFRKVK